MAFLFIPAFYRHEVTTIYEFLAHRFGQASQVTASIFFFVTRLAGSGVRLMAASLAVSILLGWPLPLTIAIFSVVSIVYIATGGVKAIVWTNVFQALVFLVAGAATAALRDRAGRRRARRDRGRSRAGRAVSTSSTGDRRRAIPTSGGAS